MDTPWNCKRLYDQAVVNDIGTKFWPDKDTQEYAARKGLSRIQCLFAETAGGHKSRLAVENGQIIHDDQTLEGMAVFLDMCRASEMMP